MFRTGPHCIGLMLPKHHVWSMLAAFDIINDRYWRASIKHSTSGGSKEGRRGGCAPLAWGPGATRKSYANLEATSSSAKLLNFWGLRPYTWRFRLYAKPHQRLCPWTPALKPTALGFSRIYFTLRFGGVHAFGYNFAESEPIWMNSGALWGHCCGLALANCRRDPRSSDSLTGRRNFFVH